MAFYRNHYRYSPCRHTVADGERAGTDQGQRDAAFGLGRSHAAQCGRGFIAAWGFEAFLGFWVVGFGRLPVGTPSLLRCRHTIHGKQRASATETGGK